MRRTVLSLLLTAAFCFLSSPAAASPWTLRQGEIAFVAAYEYQFARQEFLDETSAQNFPLEGRFSSSSVNFGLRAGFTDRLEFELRLPLRLVSYTSDPVILLTEPVGVASDFFQENIINLGQTRQGFGDLTLIGRYNLIRWPVAMALEMVLKTPTGYEGPAGTFGEAPESAEEFSANIAELARPENVTDDVALGDGQVDIGLNLLFGASFPSRTFLRADIGYNARVQAGHQILGAFKVGQSIGSRVLVFAETRFAYTVTEGRIIGISVAAIDPNLPAEDYGGTTNLRLRELRLERDAIDVGAGGIIRISDQTELNLGYTRTVWGRNTAAINSVFIGIGVRADILARQREAQAQAEAEAEAQAEAEAEAARIEEEELAAREAERQQREAIEAQVETREGTPPVHAFDEAEDAM